jgi:hypothetical protein
MTSLETQFNAMRGSGRPEGGRYVIEEDGSKERVPSVSTVNGCMHPRGLFHWHHANGLAGRMFGDGGTPALEVGTLVHRMVDSYIHGEPTRAVPEELSEMVASSFGAFKRWWTSQGFEVIATEVPLVSKVHRFGGTPDAILRDSEGRLCLGDWKSSKALYPEYLRQIASYGLLWNEAAPEHLKLTGGFHLVRFSKENGDMEHRHFPELDDALEAFLLLRRMYDLNKIIGARIK